VVATVGMFYSVNDKQPKLSLCFAIQHETNISCRAVCVYFLNINYSNFSKKLNIQNILFSLVVMTILFYYIVINWMVYICINFLALGAVSVALLITPLQQFNVNNNNKQRLTTQRRRRQDNFVNMKNNNNKSLLSAVNGNVSGERSE